MRSLNNTHSCNFTFNLIVEHVVEKLLVCAMCITCDKLVDFKLNMLNNKSCEPYFFEVEMNKLFNACCSEPLFSFSYFSLKERDHAESSAISAPKFFCLHQGAMSLEGIHLNSKPLNKLCNKKFCDIRNAPLLNFEMFNVATMKSEMLNQLCCLKEIIVLPSTMLFAVLQTSRKFNQDETISRTSTCTLNIERSYKVKAIFNSKSYFFPLASLLLGLYDY